MNPDQESIFTHSKKGLKRAYVVYIEGEMPSCYCQRCDQHADCLTVIFEEQQGWQRETEMTLCELCYNMYSRLYTTQVVEGYEECEDDPILPHACDDVVEGDPE